MRTVTVYYRQEDGVWWADSPDIQGWTAAADSYEELRAVIADGVEFALEVPVGVALVPAETPRPATSGARATIEWVSGGTDSYGTYSSVDMPRTGGGVPTEHQAA